MKIFFENINKKRTLLDVSNNITIEKLKLLIQDLDGTHSDFQNLYYNDILLIDYQLLNYYNINENSVIYHKKNNYNIDFTKIESINFPKDTIFKW